MQYFQELHEQYAHFWSTDEFQSDQMQLGDHLLEPKIWNFFYSIIPKRLNKNFLTPSPLKAGTKYTSSVSSTELAISADFDGSSNKPANLVFFSYK